MCRNIRPIVESVFQYRYICQNVMTAFFGLSGLNCKTQWRKSRIVIENRLSLFAHATSTNEIWSSLHLIAWWIEIIREYFAGQFTIVSEKLYIWSIIGSDWTSNICTWSKDSLLMSSNFKERIVYDPVSYSMKTRRSDCRDLDQKKEKYIHRQNHWSTLIYLMIGFAKRSSQKFLRMPSISTSTTTSSDFQSLALVLALSLWIAI
jgi:hypothetical protein